MRARARVVPGLAIAVVLSGLAGGIGAQLAQADDDTTIPSKHDVQAAQGAVAARATDVAGVQDRLAAADQRLDDASIVAAKAAEEFNGARWRLQQARAASRDAAAAAATASADVERQRQSYVDSVTAGYELAPGLTALSAITGADGIDGVLDTMTTLSNATTALDSRYDDFRAASTLADITSTKADDARADAADATADAQQARDQARQAEATAAAEARSIADEKDGLMADLARLQGVSVKLARQRQSGLEQAAADAAAAEAAQMAAAQAAADQAAADQAAADQAAADQAAAEQAAAAAAAEAAAQATATQQPTPSPSSAPTATPTPSAEPSAPPAPTTSASPSETVTPTAPAPTATPTATSPSTTPTTTPPAPGTGAAAAIAFARSQVGDPYQWGADGPDAWDCSGLTSGAWAAGGKSLPHYSVAQYTQSTPISASSLQPGDLVFWGSSSSPSSIYHVALYVGDGRIIQAPRAGRPVEEVSLYAWIAPNFYARP